MYLCGLNERDMEKQFKYLVLVVGGIGEDTWDKEVEVEASDIAEAARIAVENVKEFDGWVVEIGQVD